MLPLQILTITTLELILRKVDEKKKKARRMITFL